MKIAIYGPMCSGKSTIASIINGHDSRYKIYSFGQKIKDLAVELFNMEGKDKDKCIIDDLRFQNELNYLEGWKIICLTTPLNIRKDRIKELYPDSYEDHIKNMSHLSETDTLKLPKDTLYVSSDIPIPILQRILFKELKF